MDDIHTLAKEVVILKTEITALRTEIALRDGYLKEALVLQAEEYARRLGVLNGEHSTLEKMSMSYLSREAFDGYTNTDRVVWDELNKWRKTLEVDLAALKGRVTGSVFILGSVWVIVQTIISYWRTH